MRIGDLKHKIMLQQRVSAVDLEGIAQESWINYKMVHAAYRPLNGREYLKLSAINAEMTAMFIVRYSAGILNTMRIVYLDRFYNIKSVIDVDGLHRELQIMATEEVQNG